MGLSKTKCLDDIDMTAQVVLPNHYSVVHPVQLNHDRNLSPTQRHTQPNQNRIPGAILKDMAW